ncbi:pre-mRNA-splicing factor Prp9p [[Candida] anglica]|uniref:Pre-mRNA-splicing factor Prp9p n=1 Tax=[Candida] anglica TaxID=148631 RepID=A0ABP0ELK9_9ASCO
MSGYLESQRSVLEELETIENALASRFKRNPQLLPTSLVNNIPIIPSFKKRSHQETILQQHEVKYFVSKYKELAEGSFDVDKKQHKNQDVLQDELKRLDDPRFEFKEFDSLLSSIRQHHELYPDTNNEDISQVYKMFSSGGPISQEEGPRRAKRRYVLSVAAEAQINPDTLFSPAEEYGKYLDLTQFYDRYRTLSKDSELTYVDYLTKFETLKVQDESYLEDLKEYLESFLSRSQPFLDLNEVSIKMDKKVEQDLAEDTSSDATVDGAVNDKGEIFCLACDKWFTKESVYKGHLTGKKHLKNLKKSDSVVNTKPLTAVVLLKVQYLASHLNQIKLDTIANIERLASLTERERMIEDSATRTEENELTAVESDDDQDSNPQDDDDDDDDDAYGFKNLPVGADGQPMPFWLYKLQGYNKSYDCEICGNVTYKGRAVFNKHFSSAKHQQGLKCLGITDEYLSLFKSIVSIDEAVELWRGVKKEKRIREGDTENAVEVEDSEGNVMSEKDYLELKKQGLL